MARLTARTRPWRAAILACSAVYFLLPLAASVVFTVDVPGKGLNADAYQQILGTAGFVSSLRLSLELAVATIAIVLLLMVPAMVALRLRAPRLRPLVEVVCSLPLVVPPIAFVAGIGTVLRWGPDHLATTPFFQTFVAIQNPSFPVVLVLAYTVMALPFVYRALDAGLRAMDVRTLVEAARSPASAGRRLSYAWCCPTCAGRCSTPRSSRSPWSLASSPWPSCSASSPSPCGSSASAESRPSCPSPSPCSACCSPGRCC
jgi:putative spermidine/putrescine transport system permease protein